MAKSFKRLLSLAVVLFMVVSMLPAGALPVSAAESTTHTAHCVCGGSDTNSGCKHTNLTGEWKPWDGKSNITEGGNYYLTQDVTDSTQYWMGGSYQNETEMTINLCTNGHSIDSKYRVFGIAPYVTFNLMNCSETQSVLQGAASGTDSGGAIHMHAASCVFNLYDNIKIVAKTVEGRTPSYGGTMTVPGTFNMYGSELVGKVTTNAGGVLHVTGTFNMYDGVISGGTAGWAGNINMSGANARMTMTGGVITGGKTTFANDHGGNIYVLNGAEVTISGGVISNGTAGGNNDANGGNIAISNNASTTSKLTINGNAQLLGGQANRGGSIFHHSGIVEIGGNAYIGLGRALAGSATQPSGGGYAPGVLVNNTVPAGNFIISGNPTIEHLYLNYNSTSDSGKMAVQDLGTGAKIKIDCSYAAPLTYNTITEANANCFSSADSAYETMLNADSYLSIVAKSTVEHCVCGDPTSTGNPCAEGGHQVVTWQPWTDKTTLPYYSGYWYLPNNLNFVNQNAHAYYTGFSTSTAIIGMKSGESADYDSSLVTEAQHVYVDLNGKTVTGKFGHRTWRLEPGFEHTITVTDSVGGGRINAQTAGAENAEGMIFWCRNGNQVANVYGGTYDASTCVVSIAGRGGTAMYSGNLNMYGGTLIGGTANSSTGGAVNCFGTINMSGNATIVGGTATSGGAVSLGGSAVMNMSGNAKIVGGYSGSTGEYGGGSVVLNSPNSQLNMSGNAQIIGGEQASPNGSVYVATPTAKVTLSDNATITAVNNIGICLVDGAKVYVGANGFAGKVSVGSKAPAAGVVLVDPTNLTLENSTAFSYANNDWALNYTPNGMALYTPVVHCVCGNPSSSGNPCAQGGHKQVTWNPWPFDNVAPFLDGYWYLASDLDLTNKTYSYYTANGGFSTTTAVIGRNQTVENEADSLVGKTVSVYVDLNGKTLTGRSQHRIFRLENDYPHNLTITDSVGGGQIKAIAPATQTNTGMVIWTRNAGSNVTIYGGKFDASQALGKYNGGVFSVCSPVYVYGGEFIGAPVDGVGGIVYTTNSFYIYDGTFTGANVASYGGSIGVNGGKLYIYGGTITGGTSRYGGGNIGLYNGGYMNMTGGVVENGTALGSHGGNINVQTGSTANITGGIVQNGKAVVVENADPENAGAWDKCGGNIAVVHNTTEDVRTALTVGGSAQILNGEADRGGNIFVHSGELLVQGQAKILGGTAYKSENGYANENTSDCVHINRSRTGGGDDKFICKVTVAGMPEITEISYPDAIEADGLNMLAKIGVNRVNAGAVTTTAVSAMQAACFTCTNANFHFAQDASGVVNMEAHVFEGTSCGEASICGCGAAGPVVEHDYKDVPAVEPDCENTGLTAGVQCGNCGAWQTPQEIVPALGHDFTDYKYNGDATFHADGTETANCNRGCGETHTRTAEGTKLVAVAQVGEDLYEHLADAVAAAEDKTVVLLANANENVVLLSGSSLVLNGFAIDGIVTTNVEGYMVQRVEDVYTVVEIGDTVAYNATTGEMYTDLLEALEAADGTEATVQLVADVKSFSAVVPAGVTLDLNGCIAEFNYFTAVGEVVDVLGGGLLRTAQGKAILLNQEAMPVWNGSDGYIFLSNIKLNNTSYTEYQFKETESGLELTFMPWLASDLRAMFANGAADNGITMKVHMEWNGANGTMEMDVNYKDEFIVDVYDDFAQAFMLTISNASELNGLTFTIVLVSDTGATATSQTFSAN